MNKLGLWTPYVSVGEMLQWYNLGEEVAREYDAYQPDGRELEPHPNFDQIHTGFVEYVRQSIAGSHPAYHNDDVHFAQTEYYGLEALDAYEHYRPGSVPEATRQSASLALRGHDAHHCAATFRAQAPGFLPLPRYGHHVSSEWVTADANNQVLKNAGFVLPFRLHHTYIVWSSSYGGNTPLGIKLGIPQPQPRTIWGTVMRASDVCTPEDYYTWLIQTIAVNYGEVPSTPPATSWQEFIAKEHAFAGYIEFTLDQMDNAAQMSLSEVLGWRARLAERRRWIDALGDSRSEIRQFAVTVLARYRAVLQ